MMLELVEPRNHAVLKVIGVGGAGGNAVNGMVQGGLTGVEFLAMNSDAQALEQNLANVKLQLGHSTTQGLGCGGKPESGRQAAEESVEEIRETVRGADMVFVTAGMGGGTGTGAAPVVSRIAREEGALTVAVVTKPFEFEGRRRMRQADEGLQLLREEVDTLICIPNERLIAISDDMTSFLDAFAKADEVLFQGVRGISDLITVAGLINLDFADVRTVMASKGNALMGTGFATGEGKAEEAARMAISSPLLEDVSIDGAEAVLVNLCGGSDLGLRTVNQAMGIVNAAVGEDANVIFGAVIDPEMQDSVRITVIATGFGKPQDGARRVPEAARSAPERPRSRPEPHMDLVREQEPAVQPELNRIDRDMTSQEIVKHRWDRFQRGRREDSLDVPTFLRKQMD